MDAVVLPLRRLERFEQGKIRLAQHAKLLERFPWVALVVMAARDPSILIVSNDPARRGRAENESQPKPADDLAVGEVRNDVIHRPLSGERAACTACPPARPRSAASSVCRGRRLHGQRRLPIGVAENALCVSAARFPSFPDSVGLPPAVGRPEGLRDTRPPPIVKRTRDVIAMVAERATSICDTDPPKSANRDRGACEGAGAAR